VITTSAVYQVIIPSEPLSFASPAGPGALHQPESNLVHFSLKI